MEILELKEIVIRFQVLANDSSIKKKDFEERARTKPRDFMPLYEQSFGENLGVGKCLQVLADLYPVEMRQILGEQEIG